MNFFLPPWPEGPSFAMVSLGHGGIGFQFANELIIGPGLLPCQVNVEDEQRNQPYNRHVVRRRTDLPKLSPIHKYTTPLI